MVNNPNQWLHSQKPSAYGVWLSINLPIKYPSQRFVSLSSVDTRENICGTYIRSNEGNGALAWYSMDPKYDIDHQPSVSTNYSITVYLSVIGY